MIMTNKPKVNTGKKTHNGGLGIRSFETMIMTRRRLCFHCCDVRRKKNNLSATACAVGQGWGNFCGLTQATHFNTKGPT